MKFSIILVFAVLACSSCEDLSSRIVGGDFAPKNQFPHQVALLNSLGRIRCGGSIIDNHHILTAGHCVTRETKNMSVLAGSNSLSDGGVKVNVFKIVVHEKYRYVYNDIAVLRVEDPFEFGESIKPIKLFDGQLKTDDDVTIVGWGRVNSTGPISDLLKYNNVSVSEQKKCMEGLKRFDGIMCLGHSSGNGVCYGDSGGSAVFENKLVGVTNFVIGSCGSTSPDGYANVSYHYDWIYNTIDKLSLSFNNSP